MLPLQGWTNTVCAQPTRRGVQSPQELCVVREVASSLLKLHVR